MMTGALKPFLRNMRTASRPSMSGSPTSMMTRSISPALADCTALVPVSTATASNSSCIPNCSTSASRMSASSSTTRILRELAMMKPRALIAGRTTDDRFEVDRSREKEQARRRCSDGPEKSMRPKRVFGGETLRRRTTLRQIRVRARAGRGSEGWLAAGHLRLPVALGSAGIRANKREGDGATPCGSFRLVRLWWRRDRARRPRTRLPVRRIGKSDAWCENPGDRCYNRPIQLAANAAGDRLWRNDDLYDFLIELDHNARPGFCPTAGCVALAPDSFRRLLVRLGPGTRIVIG